MICRILGHHGGGNLCGRVYHDLRTTIMGEVVKFFGVMEGKNGRLTFSLFKKSLASSNSISLTPGFSTILAIGRLCLESVQRHEP